MTTVTPPLEGLATSRDGAVAAFAGFEVDLIRLRTHEEMVVAAARAS